MPKEISRKLLIKWAILFFIGNSFLLFLIGLNYLSTKPWKLSYEFNLKAALILKFFFITSYIGQLALIAFLPAILIFPLILIIPRWRWVAGFAIISATLVALWLSVDTILYNLYRFHFNATLLNLTLDSLAQNVFAISFFEMFLTAVFFISLILIEWGYAFWLWRYLQKKPQIKSRWLLTGFILCLYFSYTAFLVARDPLDRFLLDTARFLPLYYDTLGVLTFQKEGGTAISRFNEHRPVQPSLAIRPLQYPLKPLMCSPQNFKKNIVLIVVDTWRFDMIDETVMPHVFNFTQQAWLFKEHFSGGNSTGPGLFSLFYGIPSTYWTTMIEHHRPPVLFEELQKQDYRIGIFNSANLKAPPVFRNIFAGLKEINIDKQPAASPNQRDELVTQNFKKFIKSHEKEGQPFFSFVFYDSAHSYCTTDVKHEPFLPAAQECIRYHLSKNIDRSKYMNRYKNALYFVDQQIQIVLDTLSANHLLDNTIIIITGDHGEEFDDNGLGYWGHTGNFTRYQVQTPLIMYIPGQSPQVFSHRTSHFDVAPTLLNEVLNCSNVFSDYTMGKLLLNPEPRAYLLIASYVDFGIVEPNRITTIFPTGYFSVETPDGQNMSQMGLNAKVIEQAFQDMRYFYRS